MEYKKLVQDGATLGEDWSVFNDAIIGFDDQYEAGFIYQIEIFVEEIPKEIGDAISIKYNLVRVISKEE